MNKMTVDQAWQDALAVAAELHSMNNRGGGPTNMPFAMPLAVRPADDSDTPVLVTFKNSTIRPVVLVLRFMDGGGGWWRLTNAIDVDAQAFPRNTHPRVMAEAIYTAHWEMLA